MEDHQNPLRFETSPYHNVVIKDRKSMELSGVKQIDGFDSSEFLLETTLGWMLVSGKDLTLGKLEDAGLVTHETVIQNGKPNKNVYSILPAGRAELQRWLAEQGKTACHREASRLESPKNITERYDGKGNSIRRCMEQ